MFANPWIRANLAFLNPWIRAYQQAKYLIIKQLNALPFRRGAVLFKSSAFATRAKLTARIRKAHGRREARGVIRGG
jgi:hypothetical protein